MSKRILIGVLTLLVAAGLGLGTSACSSSARVHVTEPISPKMRKHDVVNIESSGTGAKESKAARRFKEELGKRLVAKGFFSQVDPDGGVVFRARVTNLEMGDEVKRELSLKGKAEVTIEIKVQEASGKVLGHFTVVSKETRKNEDDQPVLRAISAAADEVIDYLEKKLPAPAKKAVKAKPKPKPAADSEEGADEGESDSTGEDESGEGEKKPAADAESADEKSAEATADKKAESKKSGNKSSASEDDE